MGIHRRVASSVWPVAHTRMREALGLVRGPWRVRWLPCCSHRGHEHRGGGDPWRLVFVIQAGTACVCEAVTEEGDAVDREAVWRSALSVSSMMLGSESSRERKEQKEK